MKVRSRPGIGILFLSIVILFGETRCFAQESPSPAVKSSGPDWVTVAGNLDGGYRRTQFYAPDYDTWVGQWDSRIEFWLPPLLGHQKWLTRFVIYGEYLKIATYYGPEPPPATPSIPGTPRFDIRFGLSASLRSWYK